MIAGPLRHKVEVQAPTETLDDHGGVTITWAKLADRRASIEPLTERELSYAAQQQSRATVRIRMRYVSGITSKHRILFGTTVYNIDGVTNPDARQIESHCMCMIPAPS